MPLLHQSVQSGFLQITTKIELSINTQQINQLLLSLNSPQSKTEAMLSSIFKSRTTKPNNKIFTHNSKIQIQTNLLIKASSQVRYQLHHVGTAEPATQKLTPPATQKSTPPASTTFSSRRSWPGQSRSWRRSSWRRWWVWQEGSVEREGCVQGREDGEKWQMGFLPWQQNKTQKSPRWLKKRW